MKKKVLVVALGYPTKENPYEGSFFKEQVDFIATEYDCTVVVIREQSKGLFYDRNITYSELEYTKGIKQYYPVLPLSKMRRLLEVVGSIAKKKKSSETAVGIYRSKLYRDYRRVFISDVIEDMNLQYDIVYCITAQGAAYYALQFAELKQKPFVISEHRPYPHPGWSTIDVEKEAFEKADCFFAIGKDKIRQIMLQNIKLKRIVYTGNLVDETLFTYNPIPHDERTFLIVAANSYFKNFDMFIETMNILSETTGKDFRVIVAGYGANKGYIGDTDEFERKIKNTEFSDRLELIKEVARDELSKLYNRVDAFVLTSIQEGQPMVALEAACCGLPIFSTRCGGVEDYVTDEIGRIVDITDSQALAEYLLQFLDGDIIFDNRRIRERVVAKYGRDAFMSVIKAEFDRLINNSEEEDD